MQAGCGASFRGKLDLSDWRLNFEGKGDRFFWDWAGDAIEDKLSFPWELAIPLVARR
jgi:hypothetical protein